MTTYRNHLTNAGAPTAARGSANPTFEPLTLSIPFLPASKKNSQQILRRRSGRRFVRASDQAVADEAAVHLLARSAAGPGVRFGDRDVAVRMVAYPLKQRVEVTVTDAGPKPKGSTGRRRDLHNLAEVILDALQGVAFENDNQVARLEMERRL
jgi:hypothetical protein